MGAAEATGLGFVCFVVVNSRVFVVVNSRVLPANRVDLGFFFFLHFPSYYNPPPRPRLSQPPKTCRCRAEPTSPLSFKMLRACRRLPRKSRHLAFAWFFQFFSLFSSSDTRSDNMDDAAIVSWGGGVPYFIIRFSNCRLFCFTIFQFFRVLGYSVRD